MSTKLPYQASEIEFVERKSRFIGNVFTVYSEAEAREMIAMVRELHDEASHVVYAYDIASENATRFSDDGEPKGTAGMPVYEIFRREELTCYCCTVTRYFGGIKLGTGGLVRAYQGAVQENMGTLPTRERIIPAHLDVILEYAFIERFRRLLPAHEAVVTAEEFGTDAVFSVSLPQEHASAFALALAELTDGGALVEPRDAET